VGVIFLVIYGVVVSFDNKIALLEEGLVLVDSKGFDAGNGQVGDGKFSPAMAGNAGSSGQG
jgi:hypothetical protein